MHLAVPVSRAKYLSTTWVARKYTFQSFHPKPPGEKSSLTSSYQTVWENWRTADINNVYVTMAGSVQPGKKIRRISRACDYCHSRSIRCNTAGDGEDRRCRNCIDFDQACTYERTIRRRGVKPTSRSTVSASVPRRNAGTSIPSAHGRPSSSWKAPQLATQAVIMDLVEIYFEIVYPIFPLFHRPTFLRKISRGEYTTDPKLFAVTMAVCALVSARARDGAVFNHQWNMGELLQTRSETFYEAALRECPDRPDTDRPELNLLRTYALLAIISIQYGNTREMWRHIGTYHTLVGMDGLHHEANWPKDIGVVETEERRRLVWYQDTF